MAGASRKNWGSFRKTPCGFKRGTLYPALYRMEAKGWIVSEWAQSDNNRRAKYYRLTKIGKKRLEAEKVSWGRLASVVAAVLKGA